jgi:hypothetical protein
MDTKKMRVCAPLLPAPGNTVVIECLDEIDKLRHALELIRDGQKDGAKNTNIVDYINTVLTPNNAHALPRSEATLASSVLLAQQWKGDQA